MDDLISRKALIAEYDRVHVGPPGGARKLIGEAPEVKPKVVAEIKIDGETLQRMVDEAVERIRDELFGNSEQLDTISRQAVLELPRNVERNFFGEAVSETINVKSIEALPTAKPEIIAYGSGILVENTDPDVIRVVRCKDCAWWQREWSDEKDYHYCTMEDDRTYKEFYCANAERREE